MNNEIQLETVFVSSVTNEFFPIGRNKGLPCILVELGSSGSTKEVNDVVDYVLEGNLDLICVTGRLDRNPNIKTVIQGLAGIGKKIIVIADADDVIQPFRHIKNVSFVMKVPVPTKKVWNMNPENLNVMKSDDELYIKIASLDELLFFKKLLVERAVSQPSTIFAISDKTTDVEEISSIKAEIISMGHTMKSVVRLG